MRDGGRPGGRGERALTERGREVVRERSVGRGEKESNSTQGRDTLERQRRRSRERRNTKERLGWAVIEKHEGFAKYEGNLGKI